MNNEKNSINESSNNKIIVRSSKLYKGVYLLILLTLFTANCYAANVYEKRGMFNEYEVSIEGAIVKGDLAKVKQVSRKVIKLNKELDPQDGSLYFNINSSGGDIMEAIKIGRFARELLAGVNILGIIVTIDDENFISNSVNESPEDAYIWANTKILGSKETLKAEDLRKCFSACVLIFYGGTNRNLRDNHDNRFGIGIEENSFPIIGVHRPYYEKDFYSSLNPLEAKKEYRKLESYVREYLLEMGAPQSIIDRMFIKASNEIELISDKEFRQFFHSKEPFLEEWLIAKCGTGDLEEIFSPEEVALYKEIEARKFDEFKPKRVSPEEDIEAYRNYIPSGYSEKVVKYLEGRVRFNNIFTYHCKKTAIVAHQQEWAQSYN